MTKSENMPKSTPFRLVRIYFACLKEMFAEIGDNSVIGAGSVVSKDIPPNCVALGNPCKVIREISEHDKEYYYKDRKINWSDFKDYV